MKWYWQLTLLVAVAGCLLSFSRPCWAQVELSELWPRPSQGEEWIELHNTGDIGVSLTGWQLWDELSQPSLIYSFTTETIAAQGWLVVPINRKLNDSGDGATLKNASGQTVDFTHYDSTPLDLSWTKVGSGWMFTTSSPGLANPIPSPTATPTPSPTLTPTATPKPTLTLTPVPTHSSELTPPPIFTATSTPSANPTFFSSPPTTSRLLSSSKTAISFKSFTPSIQPTPTHQQAAPSNPSPKPISSIQTPSAPQPTLKITPWVNAIMANLTLSSSLLIGYSASRYFNRNRRPHASLSSSPISAVGLPPP